MANFCTKCGKPLAEGEVCSCQSAPQINPAAQANTAQNAQAPQGQPAQGTYQQAPQGQPAQGTYQQAPQGQSMQGQPGMYQQAPQGQPMYQQAPQQAAAAGYVKKLWENALAVFKAPATEGKKYVASGKFELAIGYMVIQMILAVLLGLVFEARSGLANLYGFADAGDVFIALVKVFFATAFLSALFSVMLAGLLLGFNLAAKNQMTFKNALCLASVRAIVLIPAMVVVLVFMLIGPSFGAFMSLVINIWGFVAIVRALPVASAQADNLLTHLMSAAFAIFTIVAIVLMLTLGVRSYASSIISGLGSLSSLLSMF